MKRPFSRASKKPRQPLFTPQDKSNIAWFWRGYFKEKTPWLALIFGMILVQGLVYQQFIRLTEDGLRVIFESGEIASLVQVCLVVLVIFSVRALMSYLVPRMSAWLANDAVLKLRRDLIDHMMVLDLAYFERTNSGEIILRLVNQAQALSEFVGQTTVNALRDGATVVIVSGYLFWKSPFLFSAAVIVLPAVSYMVKFISDRIKVIQQSAENAMGAYMTGIDEMSSGMRTVKISGQEPAERRRLVAATEEIKDLSIRLLSVQALMSPSVDVMAALVYILIIGGGGYMALNPGFDMDGAAIVAFMIGMALVFDPARRLTSFFVHLQANLIILDSVRGLYRERPTIVNALDATEEFDPGGDITFRDVHFSYSAEHPLFEGIDFTFEGGKVTAIVGATGSGKTTVLSLMARLYDVATGEIAIGGQRIDKLKISALRHSFSVVAQDIVIFNSSIYENIRYVRPEASEEEIWAAAEHGGIAELMRQRGTAPLGPKGSQLSGGQKQRIAIARAFLRSAPILLLDEATSALDQRTEERVQKSLHMLSAGKTTLIVAHRLSMVTHADRIYVLDAGRVVEEGSHAELLAQGGLYAGMYSAQKQSYG